MFTNMRGQSVATVARPAMPEGKELAPQVPRGQASPAWIGGPSRRAAQEAEEGSLPHARGSDSSEPVDCCRSHPPTDEMERIACEACKKESGDDSMLLCDGCDRGYHLHCLRPKLRGIPDGEWHCPVCLPMAEEDTKFCKSLEEGADVRAQDRTGQWLAAKVAGVSAGKLRIHFFGWNSRFDEWCAT